MSVEGRSDESNGASINSGESEPGDDDERRSRCHVRNLLITAWVSQ